MSFSTLPPDVRAQAEELLTRRQLDVLKLWLAGAGVARIAVMLGIDRSTARAHLRRAQQKLEPYLKEVA